eukprot:4697481-Pyramimonas_sp.AAC.1
MARVRGSLSRELWGGRRAVFGPRAASVAGALVHHWSPCWTSDVVGVGRVVPGRGRDLLAAG